MNRIFASFLSVAALVAATGAAQAQWIDGSGGSCQAACAAKGGQAMASGVYKNGKPFTICAANANGEGMRPGYNLEPDSAKVCVVGWGGQEVKVPGYACLCDASRAQAPAMQAPVAQAPAMQAPAMQAQAPVAQSAPAYQAAAPAPAPGGLTAASFKTISNDDLQKWESSGCSFSLSRGKDLVAIFDTQDQKKTALLKIDGKLLKVAASGRKDPSSYWNGSAAGYDIRMIKGKINPKYRNDGGGQGGEGRLDWSGPGGQGSLPANWEEGC